MALTDDFLQELPEPLVELYAEAERRILADMARRINAYDYFIPAADHQKRVLEEMGAARAYILRELAAMTNRTERELVRLMEEAGIEGISDDDAVYRAAGLKPQPLTASRLLQERLAAGYRQTQGLFKNLTRTTAGTASQQFEQALDNAWMMASSGAFSREEAMRTAIKQLAADGVQTIEYQSGRKLGIEAAVRLCVSTGANQTVAKMQEARAEEMGCDLVEVTAHAGARPEHAKWQGGIYSRSGKSQKYPSLRRVTGYGTAAGLCGCHCRHSFRPYIEGMPRRYTEEQLKAYEEKTREYNGQKLTEYEARQQQRKIERNIRRWKRESAAMQAAGLDTGESAARLKHWQAVQKDFLSQTGLKRQTGREQVAGFGRSEAAKARAEGRKTERFSANIIKARSTSTGIRITAVSPHLLERADERQFSADAVANALTSPLKLGKIRADRSQQFVGELVTVAINVDTGKVITAWPTSTKLANKLKGARQK